MLATFQSWARANPLLLLALSAVPGVLAAEFGGDPARMGPPAMAGAGLLLTIALVTGRAGLLPPACALLFTFIHATRLEETFHHPLRQVLKEAAKPLPATVRGRLLPHFDSARDDRLRAICQTSHVSIPDLGMVIQQSAVLLVRLPPSRVFPASGEFEMSGRIYLPRSSTNPGAFNAEDFALRNGRTARFDAESMTSTDGGAGSLHGSFLETAESCRQWIGTQLAKDLENDPQTAAVIRAMALGVSAEADEEIEDAFRDSGTLHVFAVSGLHVGLLGVIVLTVLRQLGVRRFLALSLTIAVVFAYAFITGWRPSAARAAFMVAVFMTAALADRESSLQNSLGASALILLGSDTHQLFMPGFQLSFGVLWVSALGSAPLLQRLLPLTQLDPFLPPQLANWRQRGWSSTRRWLAATMSVSFAAWIGSLPFILAHFQAVTPVAVIANCVLVPLSFLCLSTICLSLGAAVLKLNGAQIAFNNANWALAKSMVACAAWFSDLPGANFHLQTNASQSGAPVVWRVLETPFGGAANHLRVGESHWLFDTGDETEFRRMLRPYLHSSGVDEITGVFLSHNDAGHIGAVPSVIEEFGRPSLHCSTQEPGPRDSPLSSLRQLLGTSPPPVLRRVEVGGRIPLGESGGFKSEVVLLHPSRRIQNARGDDRAAVVMLHAGPWRLLWMSDAGWNTEKHLCDSAADFRCDILVRSQHMIDRGMTEEFLLKAAPRVIISGSDARSMETAPSESLAELAAKRHIEHFDTWTNGSIEMRFESGVIHIRAARSGRQCAITVPNPAARQDAR
ncbi:MAG: ComEC/Rec2 family competence protein [Prosthecobacter sp.]